MKNKAILIGRVGQDPVVRYSKEGKPVANFSFVTNERVAKGKKDTQWHRIVVFGPMTETVQAYVKKGSLLYLEGTIKYGKYEKGGVEHHVTDIIVNVLQLLDKKEEAEAIAEPEDEFFN